MLKNVFNQDKRVELSEQEYREKEMPTLIGTLGFNWNFNLSAYSDSTVIKTPETWFRGLYNSKSRLVSEDYLLNFRTGASNLSMSMGVSLFNNNPYIAATLANREAQDDPNDLIELPKPSNLKTSLSATIKARRSKRSYSGQRMSLKELATLLHHAQGITGEQDVAHFDATVTLGKKNTVQTRAAPSGGGLYPIDLYFLAMNVADLTPGVYRYSPYYHAVALVKNLEAEINNDETKAKLIEQLGHFEGWQVNKCNLFFMYVYRLLVNSRKYADSGLAFGLIEVGCTSQNVHLASTAMLLASCDAGSYSKSGIEKLIGIDGLTEHLVHFTIIGKENIE
ncbi:MAG: SagB family peptide dehydrogenase [Gammaproteobacteria bacterium]|nr:SagB family peptide dehydrogenase [Gammaproteobacteria bacterium]MDH5731239.1 SagB family peptide dehydrogenase [Gammaproteobacteria bacterium]